MKMEKVIFIRQRIDERKVKEKYLQIIVRKAHYFRGEVDSTLIL